MLKIEKGSIIRNQRKRMGITQSELACLIDVHETTIRRWEKGNGEPSISEIRKLAKALNCTEAELLNGTTEENWTLEIKLSTESNRKEVIDMTSNNCISNLNLTPNGAALTLSGGYSIFEDDDKFENFIVQLREARNFIIESGHKMIEFGKTTHAN